MIVNMLKLGEADYPAGLADIHSPPVEIFWAGSPISSWDDRPKVAIVGSRKMTAYGQSVTAKLASELAQAGVVIISGLAFGVDVAAHKAALDAGGTTVAVLASSLDNVTPRSNYYIAQKILQSGTLISERPPKSAVHPGLFVVRNRLISGLADVVLVPEAVLKSGSLHTARFALEQGKTVMAVPGNINSLASEGSNNLIKSGAIPVTQTDDVLFALRIDPVKNRNSKPFSGSRHERIVYELIKEGIAAQEELAAAARLDGNQVASTLTMLELLGYIRAAGAGQWVAA